jgi:hypothetical protein
MAEPAQLATSGLKSVVAMASMRTLILLAAATFLSGILAGGAVDRVIVGGPAWHELGAQAWAQYSRLADLGSGLVAYPIEGIGSTLLIAAATLSNHFDRAAPRAATFSLSIALALSVGGLLLTVKAAPIMLGLASSQSSRAIEGAFDQFFFWGLYLRGLVDTLAFAALIWAFSNVNRAEEGAEPGPR